MRQLVLPSNHADPDCVNEWVCYVATTADTYLTQGTIYYQSGAETLPCGLSHAQACFTWRCGIGEEALASGVAQSLRSAAHAIAVAAEAAGVAGFSAEWDSDTEARVVRTHNG